MLFCYLVIPICYDHHRILVIVTTEPHISLMIPDLLDKEPRYVEVKKTRYLQDVWSAKLTQSGKKTHRVSNRSTTTKQHSDLYIMKWFENFLDFVNRNLQWLS